MAREQIPSFSLDKPRFDQSTYIGRLKRCFDIVDPRTMFVTEKSLTDAIGLLDAFKTGSLPDGVTDEQLWQARKVKQAIIHPDTGEKIFLPFRMSGYVPFGTVTVVGMLLPNPTMTQVIFWQWINQSHNACVNYANRNATKPTPISRFVKSYIGAVVSAVSIAVGLSVGIRKAKFLSAETRTLVQRFVAYPATCSANVCNVYMMRQNELREGIEVEDVNGNVVGTSKIAAKKAVADTALTRVLLPAPILVFPPIAMNFLEKTRFLRSRPRLHIPVNAVICAMTFGLALPFAIALFPQRSKLPRSQIEERIQMKTNSTFLFYNKGL